ncbi:Retinal guanylyl cyclase 2, partial [Ophiophagus hannah]
MRERERERERENVCVREVVSSGSRVNFEPGEIRTAKLLAIGRSSLQYCTLTTAPPQLSYLQPTHPMRISQAPGNAMADKHVFSSYVRWPSWIFFNLHRAILLGMVLILSPACCLALKIGLVGPWSWDSFFSNSLPEVAAQLAMERIKKDPSLAVVHPLDYVLLEEDLQTWKAMARFVESSKNRSAFVGPLNPNYCEAASLLAQGWNQPMLSWACLNHDLDKPRNQPWFIRTLPSAATVLLTVLRYFNWAHVGIISSKGDFWVDTAHKLANVLRSHGLPVALVTSTGTEAEKVEEAWTKVEAAGNIKGKQRSDLDGKLAECKIDRVPPTSH